MKSVLIVDDKGGSELSEALSDGSISITTSTAGAALEALRTSPPDAVLISGLGDASAKFVAHLRAGLREACPPLIVVLPQKNETLRDQCLIGGAADVSPEGQPEDVTARTDGVLNGWLRGAPRKPFKASIRLQRAKQTLTASSLDLDPTGFGLADAADLASGDLVRVSLPLPGGPSVIWGRVSEVDGEHGVRFLGMSTDERVRIVSTLRTLETTTVPRSMSTPAAPVPVMTRSQSSPAVPTPLSQPPVAAPAKLTSSSIPPSSASRPSIPAVQEPVPDWVTAASQPTTKSIAPAAPTVPAGQTFPTAEKTTPPVHSAPVPPVTPKASSGIDDLIGDSLGDPPTEPPDAPPLPPVSEHAPWPIVRLAPEATAAAFREALTLGLVGASEGAPSGDVVLAFVRTLTIPEQHVFGDEPPASLPEPELAMRCLSLRLRLFAYARDAETVAATGGPPPPLDTEFLAAIDAEVNTIGAELQKVTAAFMAGGDQQRIKEINQFRNSLVKSQKEMRAGIARLKGESPVDSSTAMFLDEESRPVSSTNYAVRKELPKPVAEKPQAASGFETPEQRRRRAPMWRLVVLLMLLLTLSAFGIRSLVLRPRHLTDAELAAVGAELITFTPREHKATVIVPDGWKIAQHQVKLTELLNSYKVDAYSISTNKHVIIAFRKPGGELTMTKAAATGTLTVPPAGGAKQPTAGVQK